ncbi:MAG: FtsK/SpoIIIE domain-containing protein [Actinomycetota bacterium]
MGLTLRRRNAVTGVVLGRRFDGRPCVVPWPNLVHCLLAGVTGSGKSGWSAALIGSVAGDPNTIIVGIDLKGGVELGPWEPRLAVLASSPGDATQLLASVYELVEYRAAILRAAGRRKWRPSDGPALLLVVDELAELAALDNHVIAQALRNPGKEATASIKQAKEEVGLRLGLLASITRLARFVSVTVLCATQYPLAQVVPSELRSNLTGRIAGRVTGREQVEVALGHGLADVVSPDAIAVSEPGTAYVLGVPGYELPVRCRADYVTDEAIEARAAATAHLNHHPEEVPVDT